ncbi:transcriptional regulator family: Fungal Specific TF [Penicillium argentinense]|uniref:Transcriptional regulator family: Fungal Specific TF n=1 Tax=Penicillium argentinense TaxID=1131581 RepID=A0A9W9EWN8_9EURO|nr:transcriptional regulator family: Fungal Specific TF [Penicillium argentinense]KAJ5089271.1 transcriptional regulator family: Fungal Specific TF [Penicillium argentinense]
MMVDAPATPTVALLSPIFRRLGTCSHIMNNWVDQHWDLHPIDHVSAFATADDARNTLCRNVAEMKALDLDVKTHWAQTDDARRDSALILATRQKYLQQHLKHCVLIEIQTCLNPDQTAYDAYETEFAQILDYAPIAIASTSNVDGEQPPFVFEMVFLPLFITSLKCPFPQLRRRALQFLWEAPPAQGLFMCGPAADVVDVNVTLEENPGIVSRTASEVSSLLAQPVCVPAAANRTYSFSVSSEQDSEGKASNWLHYSLRRLDDDGRVKLVHHTVPFLSFTLQHKLRLRLRIQ